MIIIYIGILLVLFIKVYPQREKTPITFIIVTSYFFSAIIANIVYYFNIFIYYEDIDISLHSVLYLSFSLLIIIIGFYQIERKVDYNIKEYKYKIILYIALILLLINAISIYDSVKMLKQLVGLNIADIRFSYNQNSLYEDRTGAIIEYVKTMADKSMPICIFLFFFILKNYPQKRIIPILLIIASTSVIFTNITIVGRDSIFKWVMMLICNYLIFNKVISKESKKLILTLGGAFVFLSIALAVFITTQRWGLKADLVIGNIMNYYGQGYINFSKIFSMFHDGSYNGRITFPILFSESEAVSLKNLNTTFHTQSFNLNVFPTLIGSFYLDYGYWGTIVVVCVIFLILKIIQGLRINSLTYYVLLIYLFDVYISGIFYFMHYSPFYHKIFIVSILYIFIKKYLIKRKRLKINQEYYHNTLNYNI